MVTNSSNAPGTQDDQTIAGSSGTDTLTGGFGSDTITGGDGADILQGDGPVTGAWHFETFDRDFGSTAGQAFDVELGTRTGSGYVTDFDEGNLTNTVRGTTGNPEDFGVIYTSTLNTVAGGTYRLTTSSDDGSTIQIFDSAGNPVSFSNQTGGTLDYLNNDFHQGTTTRWGDVVLDPNETYTIQIRYWENRGGDTLAASITGPDTGGTTQNLLTSPMLGLPPGPEYSVTGTPAGIEGDDSIDGGAGNDTISGDGGNDTLLGGADNDLIDGGTGADSLDGGTGNDTIDGGTGVFNDTVSGGAGDDVITTGDGNDSIDGGADNDVINSGAGDDTIFGGTGNDTINGGTGLNEIDAGDGDDSVTGNRYDTIFGGEGNDTVTTTYGLAGDSEVYGGGGNDVLLGNNGNQELYGGDGDDTIVGGAEFGTFDTDTLDGGDGNDSIVAGNVVAPSDASWEARGDDMRGGAGNDTLEGGRGEDTLAGGADNDLMSGGDGDDTLIGGTGDDTQTGGDGFDTFVYAPGDGNDTITDFNTTTGGDITDGDQTNNDFLDLSAFYSNIFELRTDFDDDGILNQSVGDFTGDTSMAGGSIVLTGVSSADLTEDNVNVACFVAGTLIETATGPVAIEDLTEGHMVVTLDNGLQPVRRVLQSTVSGHGPMAPVVFSKGTWGAQRDLAVSPMHRMFVSDWRAELLFGESEVLVPAHRLANGETIYRRPCDSVTYVHLIFDAHEIVLAEGVASESFHVEAGAVAGAQTHAELLALFPEFAEGQCMPAARRILRGYEAQVLAQI